MERLIIGENGSCLRYRIEGKDLVVKELSPLKSESFQSLIELVQQVVEIAFKERLTLYAIVSNMRLPLFYLRMGMLPDNLRLNLVAYKYGEETFKYLLEFKRRNLDFVEGGIVSEMLKRERVDSVAELLSKTINTRQERFYPSLLKALKSRSKDDPFPKFRNLDPFTMRLSEKGKLTWENTIYRGCKFIPFNDLDNL